MPRTKLTALKVESLLSEKRRPAKGQIDHFDTTLPGFGLRISKTGGSWFVFYRVGGQLVRDTIGATARHTLAEARETARAKLDLVDAGKDPRQEDERQRAMAEQRRLETIGAAAESYHVKRLANNRSGERAWGEFQEDFLPAWKSLPIRDLTRKMVTARLDQIEQDRGPISRNRRLALVRAFLNWSLKAELVEVNVAARIDMLPETSRERILSDGELAEVWHACDHLPAPRGQAVRMIALTIQRKVEVTGMRHSEIEGRLWTIPGSRMKGKLPHVVPLTDQMVEIIDSLPRREHVFASPDRRQSTPIGDWGEIKDTLDLTIARSHEGEAAQQPGRTLSISRREPPRKGVQVIMTARGFEPFAVDDVGRLVGIAHDGRWGYARLIEFLSPTTMECRIVQAFASTAASNVWSLGWAPWRVHDLRRTGRSNLSKLKVDSEIRERVIAHLPAGVRATYDRHDFWSEKADALQRWNNYVMNLISPVAPNVVPLRVGSSPVDHRS